MNKAPMGLSRCKSAIVFRCGRANGASSSSPEAIPLPSDDEEVEIVVDEAVTGLSPPLEPPLWFPASMLWCWARISALAFRPVLLVRLLCWCFSSHSHTKHNDDELTTSSPPPRPRTCYSPVQLL